MSRPVVLFEVDAGPRIGGGHLGRCRPLAHALADRGLQPHFRQFDLTDDGVPFLAQEDAGQPDSFVAAVIDRYSATRHEVAALRQHGPTLVFDDHAQKVIAADFILNNNLYGPELDYSASAGSRILRGPHYAMVPPAFAALRDRGPATPAILCTFGQSAICALLPELACRIALAHPDRQVTAIVPDAFRDGRPIPDNLAILAPAPLAELLVPAKFVICGLGVSWQEIVAAGRVAVGTCLVDNQAMMLTAVRKAGFPAAAAPDFTQIMAALTEAEEKGPQLFEPLMTALDGSGPGRVADILIDAIAGRAARAAM